MSKTNDIFADAILRWAETENAKARGAKTQLLVPSLVGFFCLIGVICACISEYYSAGVGFHAAFPVKSNGESLANALMSLRLPIIFCLLAGDAILQAIPNRAKAVLDGITHGLGIWAILLLLFGVGAFMFMATFLTLGNADDVVFASRFVGWALAIASAAMFSLSFLACHAMLGRLFAVIPVVAGGLSQRSTIRAGDALIRTVQTDRAEMESLRNLVSEMEKPDALVRKAANDAGSITGKHIANAHDLMASLKIRGDNALGPDDDTDGVPDVPFAVLEERYAAIKQYTSTYFFNLLKAKEA